MVWLEAELRRKDRNQIGMDLDNTVIKGRHVLAKALKAAGVEYVFGIVVSYFEMKVLNDYMEFMNQTYLCFMNL